MDTLPAPLPSFSAAPRRGHDAQAEDRIRLHAAMLAAVGEAVVANDRDGAIIYWNRAAETLFGWRAEEVLGRHILDVGPAAELRERAAELLETNWRGETWSGEFRARRKDGEGFPVLLNVVPLFGDDGRVVASLGVCTDIGAQQREAARQRFLAEAGSILASSLDYEQTIAAVVQLAVPGLADWCTVDVVEEDGEVTQVASVHVDPDMQRLVREQLRCRAEGRSLTAIILETLQTWWEPEMTDEKLVALCGTEHQLSIFRKLDLRSGINVPMVARGRAVGVLRMATARSSGRRYTEDDVRLAEELARRAAMAVDNAILYREARRAVEAREQILRVVSHDLRNPLVAVLAHADLLRDEAEAPAAARAEWAGVVRGAAEQMNRMIGDLIDVHQLQAGHLSIHLGTVYARPLLLEAVAMFRPLAQERGVWLAAEPAEGLPPVHADRDRVLQVLSNLLGNALRLVPRGGSVVVRAECGGGAALRFAVADTGPGVPADELPHVFEPFRRGRHAGRAGLGLGLSIARGIVEAHGGRIWAESREGGGSVFAFELPVVAADDTASAA